MRYRYLPSIALLALVLLAHLTDARATVADFGEYVAYSGVGVSDNDLLFTTGAMGKFDACMLMSTAGSVDVEVSIDGTNFSTSALSLQDFGASTNDPVLFTVANRVYGFVGKYSKIRVRQNGATAATASMNCWSFG